MVEIDKDEYYDSKITNKYAYPIIIIGMVDESNDIEFRVHISFWGKLAELINRIIRYEDRKQIEILPVDIYIDNDNKWIDLIRNKTLLVKKR